MAQQKWRSDLPSDVEVDCAEEVPESRVPTLGLHMHYGPNLKGLDVSMPGGAKDPMRIESICDSGFNSGLSLSLHSRDHSEPEHTQLQADVAQTRLDIEQLNLRQEEALPSTSLGTTFTRLTSVDEGLGSEPDKDDFFHSFPENLEKESDIPTKEIFQQDEDGDTQIHVAIIQKQPQIVCQMVDLAPDHEYVNIKNDLQQTPLHLAVLTRQAGVARHLVARGAKVDVRDRHGNTPLHLASERGDMDCMSSLTRPLSHAELRHCARYPFQQIPQDSDIKNYEGETCLHLAAAGGHLRAVAHLIGPHVGTNVNIRDGRSGRTILHHAVESHHLELLVLLGHLRGVDMNIKTFDGSTPLQLALGRGYSNVVQFLLQCGARRESSGSDTDSETSDSDEEMMDSFDYDDIQIGGQPVSLT